MDSKRKPNNKLLTSTLQALIFLALAGYVFLSGAANNEEILDGVISSSLCPQSPPVDIVEHEKIQYILHDESYRNYSANVLSGAVKIDTSVFDDTVDFSKMIKFHEYLEKTFPLVHKKAKIHKVNGYGLLFEFKGSNEDLKPVVFLAHQDTVPIGDPADWEHDPWSGDYDGERIFGRGSSDCKNLLTGLMEASEMLLQDGKSEFERGFFISLGFDEEVGGPQGAIHLAEYLIDYLGENSIEYITDEGPYMFSETQGNYYGFIMTGEKGYTDLYIQINTPGGHSSIPRDHTSIGMMSSFLQRYESHMYPAQYVEDTPWKACLNCMAAHGALDKEFKDLIENSSTDSKTKQALLDYLTEMPEWKYSIRTSQAIDIVKGGDKANSLPREVLATINHRIAYGDSVDSVKAKASDIAKGVAAEFGLGLELFGEEFIPETENGYLNITAAPTAMDPVKASQPIGEVWDLFSGSIKAFYEQEVFPEKFENTTKSLIVTPMMVPGNTDLRHYLKLSPNLYRSQPGSLGTYESRVHDHDEFMTIDSHLEIVAFYYNHISTVCL